MKTLKEVLFYGILSLLRSVFLPYLYMKNRYLGYYYNPFHYLKAIFILLKVSYQMSYQTIYFVFLDSKSVLPKRPTKCPTTPFLQFQTSSKQI